MLFGTNCLQHVRQEACVDDGIHQNFKLSATACGPAYVSLNDRRNHFSARWAVHTHVGRRKSMLAIPIVLRQASRPIQYPCNVERSVLVTESLGV